MARPIFLLFILYLKTIYCRNDVLFNTLVLDQNMDNITESCKEKMCIPKCCDKNEIMSSEDVLCFMINDYTNDTIQDILFSYFENIPLYDNYFHDKNVNKNLSDVYFLVPGKFYDIIIYNDKKINFTEKAFAGSTSGYNEYLSEGGKLYLEYPNSYSRWIAIESSNFCVDIDSDTMTVQFFSVIEVMSIMEDNTYYAGALIISSIFLFLVLLVYMVLPELRNLAGLVLMAYVFSLLIAFISLAWMKLEDFEAHDCIQITGLIYFSFLSSFCWMNVMSYDIWWTFRGYAKARKIHRRGETLKFIMYCIYAWGIPMIMTIGLVEINKLDMSHIPWFVQPHIPTLGCFLQGGQQFVYLYIPMLLLIICNWLLFLMTAFNIWRLIRGNKILKSAHRSQKNRLVVYLKLSVVMGINWLLEVVSFLKPHLSIWVYTDTYNLFIGFFIFLIFIWKPKIYRKLRSRFIDSRMAEKKYNNSVSTELETNLTQQSSLPLCSNPEGQS